MQYNPLHPHCGPFNYVDDEEPDDPVDAVCWRHDRAYGSGGFKNYTHFNDADRVFLKEMGALSDRGVGGIWPNLYSSYFNVKKRLAPHYSSSNRSSTMVAYRRKRRRPYKKSLVRKSRIGNKMLRANKARFNMMKRRTTFIPRPLTGTFSGDGDRFVTSMKWFYSGQTSVATPNWFKGVYKASSIVDPLTGVSSQPLGYDQYAAFFEEYTVLMSKITCVLRTARESVDSDRLMIGTVYDSPSSSVYANPSDVASANVIVGSPGVRFRVYDSNEGGSDGGKLNVFKALYTPRKTLGISAYDNDCRAAVGSDPANLGYFHLQAWPATHSDAGNYNFNFTIFIEYKVLFKGRKALSASAL